MRARHARASPAIMSSRRAAIASIMSFIPVHTRIQKVLRDTLCSREAYGMRPMLKRKKAHMTRTTTQVRSFFHGHQHAKNVWLHALSHMRGHSSSGTSLSAAHTSIQRQRYTCALHSQAYNTNAGLVLHMRPHSVRLGEIHATAPFSARPLSIWLDNIKLPGTGGLTSTNALISAI